MNDNKSQFLSTREAIIKWLDSYNIKNYTINDDLSVDVNGNVDISNENLEIIPVKFGKVSSGFWCNDNQLTNLIGSPEIVGGGFVCANNKITSLAGSPKTVRGDFWCVDNPIISLLEIINCNFKEKFFFSIDKDNFQQKELIEVLQKHYISIYKCYELTEHQLYDIIKPVLDKEILQQKLVNSKLKNKIKPSFV